MRKRQMLFAVPAISAALLLAACGSSSSSDSSSAATSEAPASASAPASEAASSAAADNGVAAARAAVDAAKVVPSTEGLGEPIDVKSLAGKKIFSIPIDSKLEFYQVGEAINKQLAEEAGIEYTTFPADGTQTSYQQGFAQAIAAGASVILLNGPLPETLQPQIADATAAGIPVVPLHIADPSVGANPDLPYEAFGPFNKGIELATQYAIQELDGEPVKALVLIASGTGPSAGMLETITNTIATGPEGSEIVNTLDIQVPQWSTDVQPAVQSALLKDPSINAIIPIYDAFALWSAPAVTQAAPDRNIGIYSFNGTPAVMGMIKDGIVRMDSAEDPQWTAYVNMDTAYRAMLQSGPNPVSAGPIRVIDATNVDETGTPPEAGKGFGDEYPTAYKTMWGLM